MIKEREYPSGLLFLDVETPFCSASICLNGGQLTSWIPRGHDEVLFVSSQSGYTEGKPIRGGIPVCWPWFGKKEGKPTAHGYARNSLWKLESHLERAADAEVVLSLASQSPDQPSARLSFIFGEDLQMILETVAGSVSYCLTEAFHTYFRVGDVRKCTLLGLESVPYVEFAGGQPEEGVSCYPIIPSEPIDRVYTLAPVVSGVVNLVDESMKRIIEVRRDESNTVVVWNPWESGACGMPDLGGDEWSEFLCVEVANDQPAIRFIPPGGHHRLMQKISIRPIHQHN